MLYWLSGLTCNDENFTTKAGAQRIAAELGIALVMPDTSPRGGTWPTMPDTIWVKAPASISTPRNNRGRAITACMTTFAMNCLPGALSVRGQRALRDKRTFDGWPRGADNGAKNPGKYTSVSAFAPIVNPTQVPWGKSL